MCPRPETPAYAVLPVGRGPVWNPGMKRRIVAATSLERVVRSILLRDNILISALGANCLGGVIPVEWDAPKLDARHYDLRASYRQALAFFRFCVALGVPAWLAISGNKSFRVFFGSAAAGLQPFGAPTAQPVAGLVAAMAEAAGAIGHDPALYNRHQLLRVPGSRHRSIDGRTINGMSFFFDVEDDFDDIVERSFADGVDWGTRHGYPPVRLPHAEWLRLPVRSELVVEPKNEDPREASEGALPHRAAEADQWPPLDEVRRALGLGRRFACPDPGHDSGGRCCSVSNDDFWRCWSHPVSDQRTGAWFRAPILVRWVLDISYAEACGWLRDFGREDLDDA